MKKITLFQKPLYIAFFMATAVGLLLFQEGQRLVPYAAKIEQQELTILAHRAALAYLLMSTTKNERGGQPSLHQTLTEATHHPQVISASVRLPDNQVTDLVYKDKDTPFFKASELTLPVHDMRGQPVASICFELKHQGVLQAHLQQQNWAMVLAGFIIILFLGLFLFYKRDSFLPALMEVLQKVGSGNLDVSLPVPENQEYAPMAQAFNLMVEGLQERDRMRHSLGRIMDPKIAEILIKENPKVGGLRRQATILFCDIRNYTSICEQLSPDELQQFLNEYWKGTVEIIMEQEGTIDKFHGDGVCVVFGAPTLHPDDPLRAVRVAWRLVHNVQTLNQRRELERKLPIQIGIGIHTGEVIAGHIGSERRMDYTVVGDVVNVAARIEELNKKFGTHILISDNVYERVEPYVRVKTLTLAYLRGHKRPILIHALREFLDVADQSRQAA